MAKFAFILNVEGVNPEEYTGTLQAKNYNGLFGVDGKEGAKRLVEKLNKEGFNLYNLCGDFDDSMTTEIASLSTNGAKFKHADYLPEQLEKIEALTSLKEYGIIVIDSGLTEVRSIELRDYGCNAHARFVRNIAMACEAAKELVDTGVDFIELCSWFDKERTDTIIKEIEGKVPVGSCGL